VPDYSLQHGQSLELEIWPCGVVCQQVYCSLAWVMWFQVHPPITILLFCHLSLQKPLLVGSNMSAVCLFGNDFTIHYAYTTIFKDIYYLKFCCQLQSLLFLSIYKSIVFVKCISYSSEVTIAENIYEDHWLFHYQKVKLSLCFN
jgi:hypothetical protein